MPCKNKRALITLSEAVLVALKTLDEEMKKPSTVERGSRIAAACNKLEWINDSTRRFTLEIGLKKDRKRKLLEAENEHKRID